MSNVYLAYDYPVLGAFWTVLWIFLWIMWIVLLFRVVVDIFRDDTMSGWAKTGWLVLTIVLPFLGVFVYVVTRGGDMGRREQEHAKAKMAETDRYLRDTLGGSGTSKADELAKLSEVRARGDLSDEEFRRAKEAILR